MLFVPCLWPPGLWRRCAAAGNRGVKTRSLDCNQGFLFAVDRDKKYHTVGCCEATEPFIFAADLFETSALGWDQALNFLRDASQHLPEEAAARVQVLKETKDLANRATRYFDETLRFIDARAEMGWADPVPQNSRPGEIATRLTRDFEALHDAATELSDLCLCQSG